MTILFYDTETTNLPSFKHRHGDPCQPHLVQIAALLTDTEGVEIERYSTIIDPRGWYLEMPEAAFKAHGITYLRALSEGVPLVQALRKFNALARRAKHVVAHNINFDRKLLQIAWTRANMWPQNDIFASHECSMNLCTPLVKCPPTEKMRATGRNGFKAPRLEEAYEFFFGKPFENAHDAMVDTLGCRDVYFAAKAMLAEQASVSEG